MQTAKILLLVPDGMNNLTVASVCKDVCKIKQSTCIHKKLEIDQHMYVCLVKPGKHPFGGWGCLLPYSFLPGHHVEFILAASYQGLGIRLGVIRDSYSVESVAG